jgi:hypothetical protein
VPLLSIIDSEVSPVIDSRAYVPLLGSGSG